MKKTVHLILFAGLVLSASFGETTFVKSTAAKAPTATHLSAFDTPVPTPTCGPTGPCPIPGIWE